MTADKLNIALLAGGDSSEREISLGSAREVAGALDRDRYNVYFIDVKGSNWLYGDDRGGLWEVDKNDFSLTVDNHKIVLDYALIMIHGTPGEDGRVQGYLEMLGISHSACDVTSSVITFDKVTCKRAIAPTGIPLARQIYIRKGEAFEPKTMVEEIGLPMFIKPNASGSSCGVSRVNSIEQIIPAMEEALKESNSVLVEELIEGREVGCGVLITQEKEYIFPVTEIISKKEFFDYEAKYTPGCADEITPAQMDDRVIKKLHEMTLKAYRACDCRGVVRVDFIVKEDGTPVLIEVNSIPGMSRGSIVPQQVVAAGMTMTQLWNLIIEDTYKTQNIKRGNDRD